MTLAEELKQGFEEFKASNKTTVDELRNLIKAQETGTKEEIGKAIESANKAAQNVQDHATRLTDLEQKLVNRIVKGSEQPKSYGQIIVEDPAYKAFAKGSVHKCRIVLKDGFKIYNNTITGQDGSPAENSDILVAPDRLPGVVGGAFRRLRVKDLLPKGNTESNAVPATRELLFTNAATGVKEGAAKAQSTLTFEKYTANVATIAHWLKISKQVMDDAPAVVAYIQNRLAYGVDYEEELQLISGAGGDDIKGMAVSPNYTAFTPTSGDQQLDSLNRAIRALDDADYPATGVIMKGATWGKIERLKDENENYLVGSPFGAVVPTVWGVPVAVTPSMTADKLLVASFPMAFLYLERKDTAVEMFEQDDDNAQKNLITIRAEKRSVLLGLRPASVLYGNLVV